MALAERREKPIVQYSEFWGLVSDVLGARGASLAHDFVLSEFSGCTAAEALERGYDPRDVWFALCDAAEVPENLRWGKPARK